ncbi:1-(5-phosphoribosyl)-5-[(5-phosphoribosylamino)methylideneamino]imidazole-4-carboxamide isomerase [Apibacter sp.]|uniref:1-(5-phosphoribosyl)-5-[(5- phosphoribosylamino)methylideneamino]imidazole-4- carboxamide isomerase n=1 Tax=Apibacter sp. TaxID=2023709 RepID=UPI0025F80FE6|nr:1-(5-phosphoribosyl)-5-[(5-phosphoribosylamino)methylideneamino]imidazole-4-carboxamide isomerase [Apibacter sp.]MCT6868749.1 1-(5-phosphoribosyl)-5-[(5-phosphoribosylamino)methylideneamino]imidazole-4-carboxamide isomerase [Apibacter sp.]
MRIIPAIDIINGKCVRLTQGNYSTEKVYREDPLDAAKEYEDIGIQFLHVVDLDGAKSNRIINYKTLYKIASQTSLKIDFGGGLKSDEDLKIAFENGASQITGGSIAVKNQELFLSWLSTFGSDKIILGADCNHRMIATQGWTESSSFEVVDFIKEYENKGIRYVICTDISKDGTLKGPSTDLYNEILQSSSINLIASGGVSSLDDLHMLKEIGCEGAIIGKAIYEGKIKLNELKQFLQIQ